MDLDARFVGMYLRSIRIVCEDPTYKAHLAWWPALDL
jgi:hypothetical protein